MPKRDSVDKIVASYFACVTAEPFTYKGERYEPKLLRVSPYLFRGYTCPAGCAACCSRFSLDYLPKEIEPHPYRLSKRMVEFDGREIPIWSDSQDDHDNYHCRNVDRADGRCEIHGEHPFSCDFELIRFLRFASDERHNQLTQKLYGRAHAMLQIDGTTRGAKCEMTPPTPDTSADVVRKLKRLKLWCEHFGLKHKVDAILKYASTGPRGCTLTV